MSEIVRINFLKTPYGELILGDYKGKLCLCDWRFRKNRLTIDNRIKKGLGAIYLEDSSRLLEETKLQLDQYFKLERKEFDIPLLFVGTEFQKNVWKTLCQLSYGDTSTYLALSKKMGNKLAIRAVAAANGANSISIFVPCHRIIGSNGDLIGYAGGLNSKKELLLLEGALFNNQLDLFS